MGNLGKLIGTNLNDIRKARGITMTSLVEPMGITYATIQRHMTQQGVNDINYIISYCELLGCMPSDVLNDKINMSKFQPLTLWSFFPYNLIKTIFDGDEDKMYRVYIPGFINALDTLTTREKEVILYRYEKRMKLDDVAAIYNRTRERIRQIEKKAIRKLRHPYHSKGYFFATSREEYEKGFEMGLEKGFERGVEYACRSAEHVVETDHPDALSMISIDSLELSVRSYNCLLRAGITSVYDLTKYTIKDLGRIRNLGRKSIEEIVQKASLLGVTIESGEEE